MFRLLLVALTLVSLLAPMQRLSAQSYSVVSPDHYVWCVGNNSQWADLNLDQTLWKPYTTWKLSPDQPELWVRCDAAAAMLENVRHPALQVIPYAGYQIFLNGKQIGASGI
jgi:hypothetical protein